MIDRTTNGVACLLAGGLLLPQATVAADWTFEVEPYAMVTSIEGDASLGRATGVTVDVDMGDILENLELAGMIHFEAHAGNGWGMALDYGFMELGASISGSRGGVVDTDVRQGVLEALLIWRRPGHTGTVDVLAGLRWWDNDVEVSVDPAVLPGTPGFSQAEDWIDLVIGARWNRPLNQQWMLHLRGDVGGFGLQSDFTASLAAGLRRTLRSNIDINLQYKATWVDYESGTRGDPGYFQYDTVTHGPVLGFAFKF